MNTQQILKTVSEAHKDLNNAVLAFARGGAYAAEAGKNIGMAKARLNILENQLREQVGFEKARSQDTLGGHPK